MLIFNFKYEELHKKALEEDPMAFEYDTVFDNMKQAAVRKTTQDKHKREVYFQFLFITIGFHHYRLYAYRS